MDPFASRPVGRTGLSLPGLGIGTAPLGGWPTGVSYEQGVATIRRAWERGIRYFDTAPFYGYGKAEEIVGAVLADKPRSSFKLSTKVGRLLRPGSLGKPLYEDALPNTPYFDFSSDAVVKSLRSSSSRLNLQWPDIALIHDPDDHQLEALQGAMPALLDLKRSGAVAAIGVGINTVAPLLRFAREGVFDCFLLAGRYTLLEQSALDDLFPLAAENDISIIAGGVFNSGLLVDPYAERPNYDYATAGPLVVQRARQLADACRDFGVPLRAAALQFAGAHPVVASVVVGARTPREVDDNLSLAAMSIPDGLWDYLKSKGLLREDAPTPDRRA